MFNMLYIFFLHNFHGSFYSDLIIVKILLHVCIFNIKKCLNKVLIKNNQISTMHNHLNIQVYAELTQKPVATNN